MSISVIFEDGALLVLDKPSGLLSVPGKGDGKQDCLSARVQARYADALVVHRLDMATSGLMVMARGAEAQRALSMAFAGREVVKRYCAIVSGNLGSAEPAAPSAWGVVDLPIAADWPRRPLRVIDAAHGKSSVTRWRLAPAGDWDGLNGLECPQASSTHRARLAARADFDRSTPFTRLELEPLTGRSHQLRVHLAALGHPILGDMLYAPPSVQARSNRLLLHACALSLAHPLTGQTIAFASLPPF